MGILEQILENQNKILIKIKELEQSIPEKKTDTSMITSRDMINDLGICSRTFQRMVARGDMPFLIRTGKGGRYRARKCDFEAWKKEADAVDRKRRKVV